MDTDLWEIQAKAAEDSVPPSSPADDNSKPDTIALMLQSLLEERFQLRLPHEMRDFPVYLLTVGKGGSKLKLSEDQSDYTPQPQSVPIEQRRGIIRRTDDGWIANAVRLRTVIAVISQPLGRPGLDKTGLEGMFDFKLNWVSRGADRQPRPTRLLQPRAILRAVQFSRQSTNLA